MLTVKELVVHDLALKTKQKKKLVKMYVYLSFRDAVWEACFAALSTVPRLLRLVLQSFRVCDLCEEELPVLAQILSLLLQHTQLRNHMMANASLLQHIIQDLTVPNTHGSSRTLWHIRICIAYDCMYLFYLCCNRWNFFQQFEILNSNCLILSWLLFVFAAFLWWRDSRTVADWLDVLLQRDDVWSAGQHGHEGHLLTADSYNIHCHSLYVLSFSDSPVFCTKF